MELIATLALIISTTAANLISPFTSPPSPTNTLGVSTTQTPSQPSKFYEAQFIDPAIKKNPPHQAENISGGIVPHHLMASELIADYFSRLSPELETIILIGPNHYLVGTSPILTSDWNWETPYGVVLVQDQIIHELTTRSYLQIDNSALTHEHSVSGLMPFIAHYLPHAKVVPLVINPQITDDSLQDLAHYLASLHNTHFIASVDFSHYLNAAHAQKNDTYTQELLLTDNWRTLRTLGSDYTDSPESLSLLMLAMNLQGKQPSIIQNTNSGLLRNDPISETTSYFEVIYK